MKYGPMTIDYDIKGAKNEEEIAWAKSVALDIYNKMAEESSYWTEGFNKAWDYMKEHGLKLENIEYEPIFNMDQDYEAIYDLFCRAVYRGYAKINKWTRNGRVIQIDGVNAVTIQKDYSKATIHCTIEDL